MSSVITYLKIYRFGMYAVKPFDPWRSPMCTCPRKYVLHPYTGCGHGCLYCYASSYIRNFFNPRPKKSLGRALVKDLGKLPLGTVIEMSTSSDPYTPPEMDLRISREAIREILERGFRLLITTKSTLVLRDLDILARYRDKVAVAITITTLDSGVASVLEPGAPHPEERLRAVRKLSEAGVPTLVRLDPIVPYVNDEYSLVAKLVDRAVSAGALQITSSTYKARADSLKRLLNAFPHVSSKIVEAYRAGERIGGYLYLDRDRRLEYMKMVRELTLRAGAAFNTCREGFAELASRGFSCDGSSLIGRGSLFKF
ncbi:MAG: radical SAM protein [Sulfolobales archaeon]|nr:radical SAM protein [Sulfolobales archaeon]MDW8010276.1 radical SAM protein [Sulfolobales archaeon]